MASKGADNKVTPVYIRSNDHRWVPALQLKVHDGKATVSVPIFKNEQEILSCSRQKSQRYEENQTIDLKEYPDKVLPMQNVDANGNLEEYKDLVDLPFMHEAAILYNLKLRHIKEKPYTRAGDIVLAVNPYQWYDNLYSDEKRAYYSNRLVWEDSQEDPRRAMEPHVYEVSALAYKGLAYEGENQSILVSGESGAGKTETVKICLNHIACVQRGQVPAGYYEDSSFDPVVQRIVQSNPLLEAFGNATTRRNDNSSRFGKYLQLQFDSSSRASLAGSRCEVYLLEKNRVIRHDSEERTFHIFYQLLGASDKVKSQFWSELAGTNNESFVYVGWSSTNSIEGIKDGDNFHNTIEALELVGITGAKLDTLMKAICIVLQLGNLRFEEVGENADESRVASTDELTSLAKLMGVTEGDLRSAFTERTFSTGKETHKVPLNAIMAQDACGALAKECYQKVFMWLVDAINQATSAKLSKSKTYGTIGLLDIFGFEAFTVNSFEQLCINYANEKLQQKFTEDIFSNVQAEYEAEGLSLTDIWYDNNTDILDLIEGPTGLLALLNEECIRPKGNDKSFVQKALQANKDSPCLVLHRTDQLSFGIRHYAGGVMYDADQFVSKNLDTLPTDLQSCAEKSSNEIIKRARSEPAVAPGRVQGTVKRKESNIVAPTVWTKYKNQLTTLMTSLRKTQSRYIRCIKPNNKKQPILLEHGAVVEQLQCAGVVAGITISRSTFPNRLPNSVVIARYANMWDVKKFPSRKTASMSLEEGRSADCKALLTCALKSKETSVCGHLQQAFAVGRTRSYFRAGALEWLESHRMRGLDKQAVTIQRAARGWLARNKGKHENQRRRLGEQEKEAKRREADARKAQEAERLTQLKDSHRKQERELLAEIERLQKQMKQSDRDTRDAIEGANERAAKSRKEMEELREVCLASIERKAIKAKAGHASINAKLDDAKKMIEFLKKENKKARKGHDKIKEKFDMIANNSAKLEGSLRSLEDSFSDLNAKAMKTDAVNKSLTERVDDEKTRNKDLKGRVYKMQEIYMEQAEARLELQKTMARVLTMIQEQCRDQNLVEDCVVLALQVETEAKGLMTALDIETAEPGLTQSDVSETDGFSLSDQFEDSDEE